MREGYVRRANVTQFHSIRRGFVTERGALTKARPSATSARCHAGVTLVIAMCAGAGAQSSGRPICDIRMTPA